MCGISGIYRFDDQKIDPGTLERMKRATHHRGPDDQGVHLNGPVGLVHNRLSILDLSVHGHQPMHDRLADNWIVYNGEIYNFQEIRDELRQRGCVFKSTGDTEVILNAFRLWGPASVDRFNGMFAFAIYESRQRRLFLARDRIGIKPLYYYLDDRQFVFASETKAILAADGVEREINREALPELFAFRYLTGGRTLFRNIYELEPGHSMIVSENGVQKRRYWDLCYSPGRPERADTDWLDEFDERLGTSVRNQLIADVPVGCALSGGVDSSLVTAAAHETSTSTIKSFSIGFDEPAFDERPYALQVSRKLGIENYSEALTGNLFAEILPLLAWHMDEPINHPNSAGIWLLARTAREHVTVLLSGEGGDELMGGYARFHQIARLQAMRRLVPGAQTMARLAAPRLRGRTGRIVRELARDHDGMMIWSSSYMPDHVLRFLFGSAAVGSAEAARRQVLSDAPTHDLISRHLYLEMKTYLVSLLMRVDKMCMAHSLENRVPLLDHTLVDFAGQMPTALKVAGGKGKLALFRLVEKRLGRELFERKKMGFGLPPSFFRGSGSNFLRELITSRSFREREIVAPAALSRLVEMHEAGKEMPTDAVWILATFELWARTFIDRPGVVAS